MLWPLKLAVLSIKPISILQHLPKIMHVAYIPPVYLYLGSNEIHPYPSRFTSLALK